MHTFMGLWLWCKRWWQGWFVSWTVDDVPMWLERNHLFLWDSTESCFFCDPIIGRPLHNKVRVSALKCSEMNLSPSPLRHTLKRFRAEISQRAKSYRGIQFDKWTAQVFVARAVRFEVWDMCSTYFFSLCTNKHAGTYRHIIHQVHSIESQY